MNLRRHLAYGKYLLRHKWFVLLAGLKLGVPIWTLLLHDWDKFLPDEWFGYARYIFNPDGTRITRMSGAFRYLPTTSALFDRAYWLHMKRNKHHWQWWIVVHENGEQIEPMSDVYRREMLADWRGVGAALGFPDTIRWYMENYNKMKLHPDTRGWINDQLNLDVVKLHKGIEVVKNA